MHELTKQGVSVSRLVREGKSITLERAMRDWVTFCAAHEIDGIIHDNAWTATRLGMQKISAYDIYDMIDRIELGMKNGNTRSIEGKQKLLKKWE